MNIYLENLQRGFREVQTSPSQYRCNFTTYQTVYNRRWNSLCCVLTNTQISLSSIVLMLILVNYSLYSFKWLMLRNQYRCLFLCHGNLHPNNIFISDSKIVIDDPITHHIASHYEALLQEKMLVSSSNTSFYITPEVKNHTSQAPNQHC